MVVIIAAAVWTHVGFYAMILLAGLKGIPTHLYEAARIDGASTVQRIRRITLPLLRPTTMVVIVLSTIAGFQAFDFVYTFTGGGPVGGTTLIVQYIYERAFRSPIQYGLASAAGVMFFVVVFARDADQLLHRPPERGDVTDVATLAPPTPAERAVDVDVASTEAARAPRSIVRGIVLTAGALLMVAPVVWAVLSSIEDAATSSPSAGPSLLPEPAHPRQLHRGPATASTSAVLPQQRHRHGRARRRSRWRSTRWPRSRWPSTTSGAATPVPAHAGDDHDPAAGDPAAGVPGRVATSG